ncbi:hypothetical protein KSP39_PZI001671 [Platanthera zijinensis]|uniref:Transcriptional coactivator Hfi1/Transcriptional adapter 1 n=1 Tax=Platanthera zijinensis TaxID=2320716 RepID=A0AAP0BYH5_9ASPA
MPPPRIDLGELKSQLADQLGPERARRYFGYLHQLLSQKLSKPQFDKLCFSTLGRENVPLHNQLIQSVIKNAFLAKIPPPSHGPVEAPLGIPFFPSSAGRVGRLMSPVGSTTIGSFRSFSDTAELCGAEDLRNRMERIAERHGLGGVELDSANLLNNGLDAYLKRLIKSSLELVRTRVAPTTIKKPVPKQKAYDKPINGVQLDSSTHVHGGSPLDVQDFTIAMKLNPHQLGQDASLWLEKICLHSFE